MRMLEVILNARYSRATPFLRGFWSCVGEIGHCFGLILGQSANLAYCFERCTSSSRYRTDVPNYIDNVESSGDSIRMVLERIEAQMIAEVEELGANEDRRGDITRIQQEDETKKEIARRKRHFIVNVRKLKEDYLIF